MLNLEKIYTVKSNATADIRKAISRNQCAAGEYEARKVDGGFQIFAIHEPQPGHETWSEPANGEPPAHDGPSDDIDEYLPPAPEPETSATDNAPEATESPADTTTKIPERQMAVLNALLGAKSLEGKAVNERAGEWVPFADINDSNNPHNLPANALPGITGALKRKKLVQTGRGKDRNGKRAIIITITEAGIATLQAA